MRAKNSSHVLVFYRDELHIMQGDQFMWQPYFTRILHDNPILGQESDMWFHGSIDKLLSGRMATPDRVLRQFGYHQYVSQLCNTGIGLHGIAIVVAPWLMIRQHANEVFEM